MEFEWDEHKRWSNVEKHGIDFGRARDIFDGRPVVHLTSPYPDERRMLTVAILDGVYVTAVWTERSRKICLISVRRSRKAEIALHQRQRMTG